MVGDTARARRALGEAREIAEDLHDTEVLVMSNTAMAFTALAEEQPHEAIRYLVPTLPIAEGLNDTGAMGRTLLALSLALLTQRDRREEAGQFIKRLRALGAPPNPNQYIAAMADYCEGIDLRRHGRPQAALERFRSALRGQHQVGESAELCFTLLEVGRLIAKSSPIQAAPVLSAGMSGGSRVGVHWSPRLIRAFEHARVELLATLGTETFTESWTTGERLSRDEAVSLALEDHFRKPVLSSG
jgi:hypothetical protein